MERVSSIFGILILFVLSAKVSTAQNVQFVKSSVILESVYQSSADFSDIDLDGDMDLLITGRTSGSGHTSRLYVNDGTGNFTLIPNTGLTGASGSSIAFSDIDFDNDEDLLITGQASGSPLVIVSKLYRNDGAGNFSEVANTPFSAVNNSSVAFEDVDGNGTQDLIITGDGGGSNYVAELYLADSAGNYTEVTGAFNQGVRYSDIALADVDGDQDSDLLITGLAFNNPSTIHISKLFLNDGSGNFAEQTGTTFTGVANAGIAFSDIDNDNDMDLFIAGGTSGSGKSSALYLNDGSGNYSTTAQNFTDVNKADAEFSDIDLDGDQDLILCGESSNLGNITKVYLNNSGVFTELQGTGIIGVGEGDIVLSDVNGDQLPDLLITGDSGGANYISELYINNTSLPTSMQASNSRDEVSFFPNPCHGKLNIIFNKMGNPDISEVFVYDLHGRILVNEEITGLNANLDLNNLPQGSYFLQVRNNSFFSVKRLSIINSGE